MGKINILENNLANMIAAGEVVERPSSVLKELVENSLDASSKNITIHLYEAGRTKIIVEDDGVGMDRQDAILAFKRHATSKISSTFDLFRIKTLGFRGEALPSIASVAKVTMITSLGQEKGTKIEIDGEKTSVSDAPARKGTTLIIEELFYNTPARLKYLKSDYLENANCLETIIKLALSHPEVAISLYIDEKLQFSTTGRGQLLEVIANIYGLNNAEKMVPFTYKSNDIQVSGFLGKPEIARSSRYYMFTILNGRAVYMPKLANSLIDAYHDFLPSNKFPFTILNIEVDCSLVDVNVHPSKKEVRFSKEEELRVALLKVIPETLKKALLIHEAPLSKKVPEIEKYVQQTLDFATTIEGEKETSPSLVLKDSLVHSFELVNQEKTDTPNDLKKENKLFLKAIGQIDVSYIIGEKVDDGFSLIDQHAAMERINYEKFQKLFADELMTTEPLVPYLVNLSPQETILFQEKHELLLGVGLQFVPFGQNSFKVTQIPLWLHEGDEKEYIDELINQLLHGDKIDVLKLRTHAIATLACKSSLKANHRLSILEMQTLIDRLGECENPTCCPHGRPTIIHFSKTEIEKMFKRRS